MISLKVLSESKKILKTEVKKALEIKRRTKNQVKICQNTMLKKKLKMLVIYG